MELIWNIKQILKMKTGISYSVVRLPTSKMNHHKMWLHIFISVRAKIPFNCVWTCRNWEGQIAVTYTVESMTMFGARDRISFFGFPHTLTSHTQTLLGRLAFSLEGQQEDKSSVSPAGEQLKLVIEKCFLWSQLTIS